MRQSLRRPRTVSCLLAGMIAIALVLPVAPAQAAPARSQNLSPEGPAAVVLRDGVLVDLSSNIAYVMNREGRVDALRTHDGSLVWTSSEAAKPLAVVDGLLVAQAEATGPGELPIVALDRGAGRTVSKVVVDLPDAVWASVSDRPRASFRAVARPSGGDVQVLWQSSRMGEEDFQGYVPSPEEGRAPGTPADLAARAERHRPLERQQGSVIVDPRSGAVRAAETKSRATIGEEASALRGFDGLSEIEGRKFLSADGRHVLVSRSLGSYEVFERYHWSVYTRDGALVGEVKNHRSAAPFLVSGSLLIFEARPYHVKRGEELVSQPLQVQAVDLATGVESWAQPIRQVEFTGPFPP